MKLQLLSGDCSQKIYYRLSNYSQSILFIYFPDNMKHSDEIFSFNSISHLKQYKIFYAIYQILLPIISIPKILSYNDNLILIQDLGNENLSDYLLTNSIYTIPIYKKLLSFINQIQSINPSNTIIEKRHLDKITLSRELQEYLIDKFNINDKNLIEELNQLSIDISQQYISIIHRDFQPKNIMIYHNNPYVIDFQDMCLGPFIYDIASLLYSQNYILSNDEKELLILYYWQTYQKNNLDYMLFRSYLIKTAIHRLLKSFSRHYYLYLTQNKSSISYKNAQKNLKNILSNNTDYPKIKNFIFNI